MSSIYQVVDAGNRLGETPLWCERTQSLWWIDVLSARLHHWESHSGQHRSHAFDAPFLGSLALCQSGRLLVALGLDLALHDPATGHTQVIAQVQRQVGQTRLNDGRCDRSGRFWVGTMDLQYTRPIGALYRLDPDGSLHHMLPGIRLINSIAMSPDQGTLYCSDTRAHTLWAFDLDVATGQLSGQRVFARYLPQQGRPDGACVDADGFLWVALYAGGRIIRYAPDGRIDRVLALPVSHPTCLCFGGPDLRTLYITSAIPDPSAGGARAAWAGSLLALQTDVPGLPQARYADSHFPTEQGASS